MPCPGTLQAKVRLISNWSYVNYGYNWASADVHFYILPVSPCFPLIHQLKGLIFWGKSCHRKVTL